MNEMTVKQHIKQEIMELFRIRKEEMCVPMKLPGFSIL